MNLLKDISASYRLFLGFALLMTGINLLVMNDFATLWNGAEVQSAVYLDQLQELISFSEFSFRLPSVLMTVIGFLGIFFLGKKVFGNATTIDALLVLVSSFMVINMGKVATGDSWLFALLSLNFITLILFIKQAILKWKISHLLLLGLAIWVHPLSALVFSLVSSAYLYWLHPKGKNLKNLWHWAIWIVLLPLLYFFDLLHFTVPIFYLNYGNISIDKYLLCMMLGMLPWTGFLWSSLWEMLQKLRKKEEFAIITSAGLLAGLLSHSLVVQMILAFMIARQIKAYFHPNYPYKNLVKTGAILHLLFAFAGIVFVTISSFDLFYIPGFRAAMFVGAVYWMPSLMSVIGLIGMNQRFIKGGMALSGLMVTLIFWLQLYPLLETKRNLPKQVVMEVEQTMEQSTDNQVVNFYHFDAPVSESVAFYLEQTSYEVALFDKNENPNLLYQQRKVVVASDYFLNMVKDQELEGLELTGWGSFLKEERVWVLEK